MSRIKKRIKWNKHGVSEIIGNILILAITVTLFSSIMWFVTAMPTPQEHAYADMTSNLDMGYSPSTGGWASITVSHKGGQELKNEATGIYIWINDTTLLRYEIEDSATSIGTSWTAGENWRVNISSSFPVGKDPSKARISLMVADTVKNSEVYTVQLNGGEFSASPIIGARGTTPSPTYSGEIFYYYATVSDPNNDLNTNSVYLDASSINPSWSSLKMTDSNNDGVFTVSSQEAALRSWNGKIVIVNATDLSGNTAIGRITLSILLSGSTGGVPGTGGEPPGNLDYSGLQGFNVFELSDWNQNSYNATPIAHFNKGETAVVVVASKYLVNMNNENIILVMNPSSKTVMSSVSSPANSFLRYDFNSGFYVYYSLIDTNLIPDNSAYLLQMQLRDSWVPNNIFFATTTIAVGSGFEPTFLTFKDPGFSIPSVDFTTNEKVYVEIRTQNGGPWIQYGGDVEIRDFFWNAQIKRTPFTSLNPLPTPPDTNYNGPVSNVWQINPPNGNVYRFVINLQNNTQGSPWTPGTNSYALRYDMFRAGSETYVLSKIISITAPKWVSDIVVAGDSNANGRFATYYSLFFYKNDNQWTPPDYLEESGDKNAYQSDNKIVRAGDIDGDEKSDFVTVREITKPNALKGIYLDLWLNRGSSWIKQTIATLPAIPSCMALGNLDLDNDLDIVIGYNGAQSNAVVVYRNNGLWTSSIVGTSSAGTVTLNVADMDLASTIGNDPLRSKDIVAGRNNGMITVYKNQLGTGASWTSYSLTGANAEVFDWISRDLPIYGTVYGTYLNTTYPSQNDGIYQQITEEYVIREANENPSLEGPLDTVTDDKTNLYPGDELDPYTVLPGLVANINKWDSTNLIDTTAPSTAVFKIRYKTDPGYASADKVFWWEKVGATWTPHEMFTIVDTGGLYVVDEFDLKPSFSLITTTLADLNVTFENTATDRNVDFDYWTINVTYIMGDRLEHKWEMNLRPGTAHAFSLYALRSALNQADTIKIAYSIDNITFMDLGTITDQTLPMDPITAIIPAGVSGTIYLKVYDTVRSSDNPTRDWVRISQLTVKTMTNVALIGSRVLALDIDDINGDGSNDIAVIEQAAGNTGKVWICYNSAAGIFSSPVNVFTSAAYYQANSIGIGRFLGTISDTTLDIMVSTPTQVSMLQNNAGTFAQVTLPSMFTQSTIVKALAGDVDGNRFTDVLVLTSAGQIILYSDYLGTTGGWQRIIVDNLAGTGRDIDIGRLQN